LPGYRVRVAPGDKSLGNTGGAEISLGQQTIMDGAEQAQISDYRGPATRPRLLVVRVATSRWTAFGMCSRCELCDVRDDPRFRAIAVRQ